MPPSASVVVPTGTNDGPLTLVFPTVPASFLGTTYARFRLSTDDTAANPTGAAADGEVEDYAVTIRRSSSGVVVSAKNKKIASGIGPGPFLSDGDLFGMSTVPLGDLDGDGVEDLAVGAPSDDTGGSAWGAVHVLFMNADGTVDHLQKIAHMVGGGPPLDDSDSFGNSLAALGDLDGDGTVDLAVGAPFDDTSAEDNRGAVYVLFMNPDGTVKSHRKIAHNVGGGPSLASQAQFGRAVATLGDLDGDGVTEVAVGVERDSIGGQERGAVYVLFMNSNGSVKSSTLIAHNTNGGPNLETSAWFGASITGLGDINGDGIEDMAAGAPLDITGGSERGAVYVMHMNANGSAKNIQKIASNTGGGPLLANRGRFGVSVSGFGDLDGDGITELAVGVNEDTGGTNRGAVHVLFIDASGSVKRTQKIASSVGGGPALEDGDFFGSSVALIGDFDGDGISDLLAGARGDENRGAVYLLSMNANGTVRIHRKITADTATPELANGDMFGSAVASLGDLDGDGVEDLAVGAQPRLARPLAVSSMSCS